jgi:hypothetical protein
VQALAKVSFVLILRVERALVWSWQGVDVINVLHQQYH